MLIVLGRFYFPIIERVFIMKISLGSALDRFFIDRETYCASSTVCNYRHTLGYFSDFVSSEKGVSSDSVPLCSLCPADIRAYVVYLRGRVANDGHPFKPSSGACLSRRSVRDYVLDVKTFIHFCLSEGYIDVDIVRNIRLIKPEKKLVRPLTASEVMRIDDYLNSMYLGTGVLSFSGCRNFCIVYLMLEAGLRVSEVCNLSVSDFDIHADVLYIRQGKGAKDRLVPVTSELHSILFQYLLYRGSYFADCDSLLLSGNHAITPDCVKMLFSRIKHGTGIERLHPHLLRHTFATSYILCGGDLETLRMYLGHSNIGTTQNYLHIADIAKFNKDVYKLDLSAFRSWQKVEV